MAILLRRLAAGDRDAVAPLFETAKGPLLGFFVRLCRSHENAEDLLQNTFLSLWRYRVGYGGIDSARGYLYRVALHEWHRSLQKSKREEAMREELDADHRDERRLAVGAELDAREFGARVKAAIRSLPEAQREALILHRFQELSCREIAETTGESVKTIESRLRLALQKLTAKLQINGGAR